MNITGVPNNPSVQCLVYDPNALSWVAMTQPVVNTDNLTVTGTMDLSKYGGIAVGASNAQYIQAGTGATFPIKIVDTNGIAQQISIESGCIRTQPYQQAISEGDISGHTPFTKIGYLPSVTAGVDTDVWSYAATQPVYVFPTAPMGMEVVSSNNTGDIGTVIHSGTSTGGTTTSLISAGENFLTTTAAGDVVLLNKSDATSEYGYISAVVSNTEITISNGFNHGGTGSGREYYIIDNSATVGAQVVEINYLDGTYAEKRGMIILNGTTPVPSINLDVFRINTFRVIAAGSNHIPSGNLSLRHLSDTPVYSYITAGYTRARNSVYTVPLGKTLYVTDYNAGFATTGNGNKEYARITTRANIDPTTSFNTDGVFYPFTDTLMQNTTINTVLSTPTKCPQKTDIRITCLTTYTGAAITTLRGWLEVN